MNVPGPGTYWGHDNWAPGFGYEVDYEIEYIPMESEVWNYWQSEEDFKVEYIQNSPG